MKEKPPGIYLSLFALVLFLGIRVEAGNNQWTKLGPPGVGVLWLAIDPVTPAKIYLAPATFNSGIFKSATAGGSWNQVTSGIKEVFVYCLAVNKAKPQTLYAAAIGGGNGGIYKSTNSGSSWVKKTVGSADNDIRAVAIDATNSKILYAGSMSQGVWRSSDEGGHWTQLSLQDEGIIESCILSLAIDPSGVVYAGTSSGVWKSSNGGSTWQRKGSAQLDKMVRALAIGLTNGQVLYAGVYGGFIYKTENGGDSWTAEDNGHGSSQNVYSIAIDPVQNETVYAASTPFGFFKTINGGADWTEANTGLRTLGALSIAAVGQGSSSPTLYLGTGDGAYKSADRGSSWTEINTGLSHHYIPRGLTAIGPQTLYAPVHLAGVAKSTDGGSTWVYKNNGLDNFYPNYLTDGPGGDLYLASALGYGVFKSVDGGDNWIKKSFGLPAGDVNAIAAYNDAEVYGGTLGYGVYKTLDGGDSWEFKSTGLPGGSVSAMAVDRMNHIIYAAMYDTTGADGLYKTIDGGDNWTPAHPYLANVGYMPFLVLDPADPTTLFVGVEGSYFGYGIFKLTGSGAGAELLLYGLIPPSAFAIDPADAQKLYAGAGDGKGVIVSASGGLGWAFINKGMPSNNITSLVLNPSGPTTVWAGTDRGSVLGNTVSAYLIIKSPNGLSVPGFLEPESWNRGSVQAITWDSTGVSGNITLQLYRNGKKLGKIASVPASAGTYSWIVGKYGAGMAPGGTGYQIRIQSLDNLQNDMSDGSFVIVTPAITVTAPNGGESWTRGSAQDISWITSGLSSGDVIIQLYRNGTKLGDIATVAFDASPYGWSVGGFSGGTAPLGGGYKIKIKTPDGKALDLSNAAFTLTQ